MIHPRPLAPAFFSALLSLGACSGGTQADTPSAGAPMNSLETFELHAGTGATVAAGQTASVQYTGWLYDAAAPGKKGRQFDSSKNTGQPFAFVVGAGQVIKGWDQGVVGMKVGERRLLTIPAALAYGNAGAGGVIPPGATLIFEVELVGIQ